MKIKKICIFGLIGLLLAFVGVSSFETTTVTAVAAKRKNVKKEPIFYISKKGKVCFGKKISKFGEVEHYQYKGKKYLDWFADWYEIPVPIEKSFKFTSKKDVSSFSKKLFGKKMKADKTKKINYTLPKKLGKSQYNINYFYYIDELKELWVNFTKVSKDSESFTLIYVLNKKSDIIDIDFLID